MPKKKSDKDWMQNAVKRPGALHKKLGVPEDKKIPAKKLAKAKKSDSPLLRQEANFASIAKKLSKKK